MVIQGVKIGTKWRKTTHILTNRNKDLQNLLLYGIDISCRYSYRYSITGLTWREEIGLASSAFCSFFALAAKIDFYSRLASTKVKASGVFWPFLEKIDAFGVFWCILANFDWRQGLKLLASRRRQPLFPPLLCTCVCINNSQLCYVYFVLKSFLRK